MATCIHGFSPDQCLICQTLNPAKDGRSRRRTATAERDPAYSGRRASRGGPVEVVDDRHPSRPRRATTNILIAVVVIVVAIAAFWVVSGIIFALLRLLEIVIVAVVAGLLGYRLGRARGHRER
jgi:Flp pilus assembly protein TadB